MADISGYVMKGAIITLIVLVVFMAVGGAWGKYSYDKQLVEMQNSLAQRDTTIEVQKGVYDKLVIQSRHLEDLLDTKDEQMMTLRKELEKKNQEILTLTSVAVSWKKAYEALVKATQSTVTTPTGEVRTKVEFVKDFGYIGVNGWTLTNPPEAFIRVQQNRALKLSLAITQDENKIWHSFVTSSEENVSADIQITGVNPFMIESKWYEYIGVSSTLAIGGTDVGVAGLAGIGLTYKIGKFEIGPSFFVTVSNRVDKFVGASFIWHPFER